jgi:Domain of unknown function (DUF4440)
MRFCWLIPIALCAQCLSAGESEEKNVIATVQKFFDAMAAHDPDAARALSIAEGRVIGVGEKRTTNMSQEDFAVRLGETRKSAYLERMWNPKVLIRGSIANVWADYDFHLDGKRTHCGIDSFSLVKSGETWKIAGIVYTVETTGCVDKE